MIDATQNSTGGSALDVFFRRDRIMPGDQFYIQIQL
jgi:hypothetical protein